MALADWERHPAQGSPWGDADGVLGRVVTWPNPEVYVLVDGVLLRAAVEGGDVVPGRTVGLRLDQLGRLVAAVAPPS
jgi:hypothetical protein